MPRWARKCKVPRSRSATRPRTYRLPFKCSSNNNNLSNNNLNNNLSNNNNNKLTLLQHLHCILHRRMLL